MERRQVRRKIKENRRLSLAESTELANAYRAGASQVALARKFGVHKHTVRAHLQRHEVAFRPVRSLTASQEVEVGRLHGEEAWSLMQLAVRFAVDEKTVRNVLARQRTLQPPEPEQLRGQS